MIRQLLRVLRHQHSPYREYRIIKGHSVPCHVCECGFVKPIIERTEEELERAALLRKQVAPVKARLTYPRQVENINKGRRTS